MFKKMFLLIGGIAAVVGAGVTAAVTIPVMSSSNANKVSQVETSKNEEIATLETKVSNLEATNASNEQTLAEQRAQIDELQVKADLSVEQEATLNSLRNTNAKLNATNKALSAEITELNQLLEDYQSGSGATGTTAELNKQITDLQNQISETQNYVSELEELVNQYKELNGPVDHTSCNATIADLTSQLEELQTNYNLLNTSSSNEKHNLEIEISSLEEQITELNATIEEKNNANLELQQQCEMYQQMVAEFQASNPEYTQIVKAIRYNLFTVKVVNKESVSLSTEQMVIENQKINFRTPGFYDYYTKENEQCVKNTIAIYGNYALYNNVNDIDTTGYGISIDSMSLSQIPTNLNSTLSYYEAMIEIDGTAATNLYLTTTRILDVKEVSDALDAGLAPTDDKFNKIGTLKYIKSSNSSSNSYSYYYVYTYAITTYLSNKKVTDESVTTTPEIEMFYTKEDVINPITDELEYTIYLPKESGSYIYYNENYTGINNGDECYLAIMVTIEKSQNPADYIRNYETNEYIINGTVYSELPEEYNYANSSETNLPTITPYETVISKRKEMTYQVDTSETTTTYFYLYSQIFTYDYQEIKGDNFDKYTPSETTGSETISIEKD